MFGNFNFSEFCTKRRVEIDVLKAKLGFGKNTQKQSGGRRRRRRTRKNKKRLRKTRKARRRNK